MARDLKAEELVDTGICLHHELAAKKVAAFREWYADLPRSLKWEVDQMRNEILSRGVRNLGPNGADEILASLFLNVME